MLKIQNLTAGYHPGEPVLRNVNLTAPEGSITILVGPNGCGKSTLLKAITGILPCQGEIYFRDFSLVNLAPSMLAKKIAFLPQSRPVPEIEAGKLVLHGRFPYLSYPRNYRESDKKAAEEAMRQLGIEALSHRLLPSLSGGERQKVYLAMLLAQDTPIIAMDEPTSYLDISYKFELMQTARTLADQGKCVLMVLHDLDLAIQYADQIAVMDKGKILQYGTPEEMIQSGILEKVFHIRIGQTETPEGIRYYFIPQMKV